MMAEVLRLARGCLPRFRRAPCGRSWRSKKIRRNAPWAGCSLQDLIQPSFSFMVGVAVPYSDGQPPRKGQSKGLDRRCTRSGVACLLVALGIFLRRSARDFTRFTFEDIVTQTGLRRYRKLFLLASARSARRLDSRSGLILAATGAAFRTLPAARSGVSTGPPARR